MPLIIISTGAPVAEGAKMSLAEEASTLFSSTLNTALAHVHVQIVDGQFLSFGGDTTAPAATVTVKAAHNSISKDARKSFAIALSEMLPRHITGLSGDHIYMTFEELPVQNFAVGDAIMTFDTMHTAKSVDNLAEAAP